MRQAIDLDPFRLGSSDDFRVGAVMAIEKLTSTYLDVSSLRHPRLFGEFLPTGYRLTTLSCVPSEFFEEKLCSPEARLAVARPGTRQYYLL